VDIVTKLGNKNFFYRYCHKTRGDVHKIGLYCHKI